MKRQAFPLLLATAVIGLLAEIYTDKPYACRDDSQFESVTVRVAHNPMGEAVR